MTASEAPVRLYRPRVDTVEAVQFVDDDLDSAASIADWCGGWVVSKYGTAMAIRVPGKAGNGALATVPDYIVKSFVGGFDVVDAKNFTSLYRGVLPE